MITLRGKKRQDIDLILTEQGQPYKGAVVFTITKDGKDIYSEELSMENGKAEVSLPKFAVDTYEYYVETERGYTDPQKMNVRDGKLQNQDNEKKKIIIDIDKTWNENRDEMAEKTASFYEENGKKLDDLHEGIEGSKKERKLLSKGLRKYIQEEVKKVSESSANERGSLQKLLGGQMSSILESLSTQIKSEKNLLLEMIKDTGSTQMKALVEYGTSMKQYTDSIVAESSSASNKQLFDYINEQLDNISLSIPSGGVLDYEVNDKKRSKKILWSSDRIVSFLEARLSTVKSRGGRDADRRFAGSDIDDSQSSTSKTYSSAYIDANFGGGGGTWGSITGTLSDQTDLQAALDAKVSFPGFTDLPTDYGVTLATVATTGAYSDLSGTPTIPDNIFEDNSGVIRQVSGYDDDFVFGSTQLDDTTDTAHDNRFFFNKSKGAFRAGGATGDEWDDANIGSYSFGLGYNAKANGTGAYAFGYGAHADGNYNVALGKNSYAIGGTLGGGRGSVAIGQDSSASGGTPGGSVAIGYQATAGTYNDVSIGRNTTTLLGVAIGLNCEASSFSTAIGNGSVALSTGVAIGNAYSEGIGAIAIGENVTAHDAREIVLGTYNVVSTGSTNTYVSTDSLFVIGNGTSGAALSNAFQMLKDGSSFFTNDVDIDGDITLTGTVDGIDIATDVAANTAKVTNATHTGDVTGDTVLTIAAGAVDIAMLSASGTPTSSNFLRGDYVWATPAGSGDMVLADTQTVTGAKTFEDGTMLLRNVADTFDGVFTNTNTADRTYTLQDSNGTIAFTSDVISDHTALSNIGTNTHAQIDTHIADSTIHFTQAAISITESQISDLGTYSTDIHSNIAALDLVSGINTGDQTSIVGITGTKAQFNTACTDGTFLYVGDVTTFPGFTSLAADYSFTDNSSNWNTAYGWGDHSSQGYITTSSTDTLTNKRITDREGTTTSTASLTINSDNYDIYTVTALAVGMVINAPTGTPTDGQDLLIRILDNGTARALTWNAAFRAVGVTLPTTTEISTTLYVGCKWNADDSKWDALAVSTGSAGGGGGASELSDLSDVNTSTATNGNVLVADGTDWESRALTEADISDLGTYATDSNTMTFTNKRVTERIGTTASTSSLTINADNYDQYNVTALAANMTINAFTGTPTDGQKLWLRILDNGTSRTLTWNAIFRAVGVTLPTATTISTTLYVACIYNAADSKWDTIASTEGGGVGGGWVGGAPAARFRSAAGQSADSTSDIAVQWDTEAFKDSDITHSTVTNNSRITVGTTARYLVSGTVIYTGTTANYRFTARVSLRKNGTTTLSEYFEGGYIRATSGADNNQVAFSIIMDLTASDYIEVLSKRINTTTGNATITAGTNLSIVQL